MLISSSLCKELFISARITLPIDNLFSEIADMKDPLIGRPTSNRRVVNEMRISRCRRKILQIKLPGLYSFLW